MPDTDVTVTLDNNPALLCTGHTDGTGAFTCQITLPPGSTTGGHSVVASGTGVGGGPAAPTAPITVQSLPTPPPTSANPGRDAQGDASGLALLAFGLLMAATVAGAVRLRSVRQA
jgi:hypothetical protein